MTGKIRVETAEPVVTLGDLHELVARLDAAVDHSLRHQTQAETPLKVEVTFGGRIKAVVLTELAPDRIGSNLVQCDHENVNQCVADGCPGRVPVEVRDRIRRGTIPAKADPDFGKGL